MPSFSTPIAVLLAMIALGPAVALAEPVCMADRSIGIPQDGEGVYINLVTGESAGSEGAVPGFDFDPYAQQTSEPPLQLRFYWGSASNGGAGVASSADTYAVLAEGDTIDAASTFTRMGASGDTSAWRSGIDSGYLGVRFTNEATTILSYGWIRLSTTAPLGFPATVIDWCYEDSGAGMTITPIPSDTVFCNGFDGESCSAIAAAAHAK